MTSLPPALRVKEMEFSLSDGLHDVYMYSVIINAHLVHTSILYVHVYVLSLDFSSGRFTECMMAVLFYWHTN